MCEINYILNVYLFISVGRYPEDMVSKFSNTSCKYKELTFSLINLKIFENTTVP